MAERSPAEVYSENYRKDYQEFLKKLKRSVLFSSDDVTKEDFKKFLRIDLSEVE